MQDELSVAHGMSDVDAYRAAGQAVAGLSRNVPFEHVSARGLQICWAAMSSGDEVIVAAIWLAGAAAVMSYRFGQLPQLVHLPLRPELLCQQQLQDFARSRSLIDRCAGLGVDAMLYAGWLEAEELVHLSWSAIEAIAEELAVRRQLNPAQVRRIAESHECAV
jgi:hypothetical protein